MSSSVKESVKPQRKVKQANQAMVICSMRTRPKRSDNAPAAQPPIADITSAEVAMSPASPLLIPQLTISVGMTKV